ncbi:hypothetical protein EPN44_11955 [bacterium]|nr:MAG: hypothetical protein EPN44_11955 [bacterium]
MRRVVKGAHIVSERYLVTASECSSAEGTAPAGDPPSAGTQGGAPRALEQAQSAALAAELDVAREQAFSLVHEAHDRAAAIVTDARAHSEAMIDEAAQAVASLREGARSGGYDEGLAQGHHTAEEEMAGALSALRSIVEAARDGRRSVIASAEAEIVRLAMLVAQRVVHREIESDPRVVLDVARAAIARLSDKETMVVRVNPGDLETVRTAREELFPGDARQIRFVGDLRVDRGGVVIDTEAGSVDAKIEHQLQEARRLLHLDEEEITLDRQVSSEGVVGRAEAS